MEEVRGLFEQAAAEVMRQGPQLQEAHQFLLMLRDRPDALDTYRYVLEHTTAPSARFQAATSLREVVLRTWTRTDPTDRQALRTYLLNYIIQRSSLWKMPYERRQLYQVVAVLVKRGWLEESSESKMAFFARLDELLASDQVTMGLGLLSALVNEFTATRATAVHVTKEFHMCCQRNFEDTFLKRTYQMVLTIVDRLRSTAKQHSISSHMESLLSAALGARESSSFTVRVVTPHPCWRDALLNVEVLQLYFDIYSYVRTNHTLAHHVQQILIQLACISARLFDDKTCRQAYLSLFLNTTLQQLVSEQVGHSDSVVARNNEMLSFSQVILCLVTNYRLDAFLELPNILLLFQELANFTCTIVDSMLDGMTNETFDGLLEAWVILVSDAGVHPSKEPFVAEFARGIFQFYAERKLVSIETTTLDDQEDEFQDRAVMDEHLSALACLARIQPVPSLQLLTTLLNSRTTNLHRYWQNRASSGIHLTSTLDGLHWLVLLVGYVIADEDEGEQPTVPARLQKASADSQTTDPHTNSVLGLSSSLFSCLEVMNHFVQAHPMDEVVSPLVLETLAWCIRRWSRGYLFREEISGGEEQPIHAVYGVGGLLSQSTLNVVLQTVRVNLTALPSEAGLAKETCRLLLAITTNLRICVELSGLELWWALVNDTVNSEMKLPPSVHRTLVQALCHGCMGGDSVEERNQLLSRVVGPLSTRLSTLLHRYNFITLSQQPDVIAEVSRLLEMLRGLAKATDSRSHEPIYAFCYPLLVPLTGLVEVYKNCPEVVILLLKLFCDFVEAQIPFLKSLEVQTVVNVCLHIFQKYAHGNIGLFRVAPSAAAYAGQEEERYKDVLCLLRLLTSILSRGFLDFSGEDIAQGQNAHEDEAAFTGLRLILPLISLDMLQFPKLSCQYFALVHHLLTTYPETTVRLDTDLFFAIMKGLEFGMEHHNTDIARQCLEAVAALAHFHASTLRLNGSRESDPHQNDASSIMHHLLRHVLSFFLLKDFHLDIVDAVSDALLSLITCEQDHYNALVQAIINEQQTDTDVQERLIHGFNTLMSANGLTMLYNRRNRTIFRKNIGKFITEVRGLLHHA